MEGAVKKTIVTFDDVIVLSSDISGMVIVCSQVSAMWWEPAGDKVSITISVCGQNSHFFLDKSVVDFIFKRMRIYQEKDQNKVYWTDSLMIASNKIAFLMLSDEMQKLRVVFRDSTKLDLGRSREEALHLFKVLSKHVANT